MTVLMHDAKRDLLATFTKAQCENEFGMRELLYADDILFVGCERVVLEQYMHFIGKHGASYGMKFNHDQIECLKVNYDQDIMNDLGLAVKSPASLKCLGALITHDGKHISELNRRIGVAREEFNNLRSCWRRSHVSLRETFNIYLALVLSKLFHGLESICLLSHEKKQLNGFHASCCRKILNLSIAFVH